VGARQTPGAHTCGCRTASRSELRILRSERKDEPPRRVRESEQARRRPVIGRDDRHERNARAWLGESARGGERLSRLFQIGSAGPAVELERKMSELSAKVAALETELQALRGLDTKEVQRVGAPTCRRSSFGGRPNRASATTSSIAATASTSTRERSGSGWSRESSTGLASTGRTHWRSDVDGSSAGRCSSPWKTSRRSSPRRPRWSFGRVVRRRAAGDSRPPSRGCGLRSHTGSRQNGRAPLRGRLVRTRPWSGCKNCRYCGCGTIRM